MHQELLRQLNGMSGTKVILFETKQSREHVNDDRLVADPRFFCATRELAGSDRGLGTRDAKKVFF